MLSLISTHVPVAIPFLFSETGKLITTARDQEIADF